MEKTQLYIPDKCKVGLQLRQGTYTGKLGYIIYHDGKVWLCNAMRFAPGAQGYDDTKCKSIGF